MRNIPTPIPSPEQFIASIPLLDENFDEENDFAPAYDIGWTEDEKTVPTTLKVRGYL